MPCCHCGSAKNRACAPQLDLRHMPSLIGALVFFVPEQSVLEMGVVLKIHFGKEMRRDDSFMESYWGSKFPYKISRPFR